MKVDASLEKPKKKQREVEIGNLRGFNHQLSMMPKKEDQCGRGELIVLKC